LGFPVDDLLQKSEELATDSSVDVAMRVGFATDTLSVGQAVLFDATTPYAVPASSNDGMFLVITWECNFELLPRHAQLVDNACLASRALMEETEYDNEDDDVSMRQRTAQPLREQLRASLHALRCHPVQHDNAFIPGAYFYALMQGVRA
jgi:hypothetical protein